MQGDGNYLFKGKAKLLIECVKSYKCEFTHCLCRFQQWFPSAWLSTSVSEIFPTLITFFFPFIIPSSQADERYRKNIQGSPQTAPPPKQPPLPPRSSEPYSNGGSASEASAMHRPMEPQVTPRCSSVPPFSFFLLLWTCTGFFGNYVFSEGKLIWDVNAVKLKYLIPKVLHCLLLKAFQALK